MQGKEFSISNSAKHNAAPIHNKQPRSYRSNGSPLIFPGLFQSLKISTLTICLCPLLLLFTMLLCVRTSYNLYLSQTTGAIDSLQLQRIHWRFLNSPKAVQSTDVPSCAFGQLDTVNLMLFFTTKLILHVVMCKYSQTPFFKQSL